jgi:hypothetical protein
VLWGREGNGSAGMLLGLISDGVVQVR